MFQKENIDEQKNEKKFSNQWKMDKMRDNREQNE